MYNFIVSDIIIMDDYDIYNELKSDFKSSNRNKWESTKKYGKYKFLLYGFILFLILLPEMVLFLTKKTYEYTLDIDNLPEPIQTSADWWITKKVHWENVQIDFLAKYDIKWKVISVKDYVWLDIEKALSPRDFALWRWKISKQEIIDKLDWNDYRNRFIYAYVPEGNEDRFDAEFSWNIRKWNRWTLQTQFSNNHLIPANKKIKRLIKKIKEGDVVRLQWYLIYAHYESGQWSRGRHSSMNRKDTWAGACEVIYVTDITRLKEK